MRDYTKKEKIARIKMFPLYWNAMGTIGCSEHKPPEARKMAVYEAWNYARRCDVCKCEAGHK